ncbi:hypothetical protein Tco_0019904 [Tanacetum coccineum]
MVHRESIHQVLADRDGMHNGDHGSYDTLIQDQMVYALRKCILTGLIRNKVHYTAIICSGNRGFSEERSDSFDIDWNWRDENLLKLFDDVRQLPEMWAASTGYKLVILNSSDRIRHAQKKLALLIAKLVQRMTIKSGQFGEINEGSECVGVGKCAKPKWVKDSTYHKEKMLLCKQAEKGVQLQAEQSDWLADTDEEIEIMNKSLVQYDTDTNVFTNDLQHFVQSESINNTCVVETGDGNVIPETSRTLGESNSDCLQKKGRPMASNVFRKEREQYFEIQDLKAQLQDKNIAISELKKLIEKCKGKSVDTKFDKPSVVRQPNAQRIPKPSVLGKPAPFSNSLERTNFAKKKSVSKTNESEGLSKPVTPQNLPQTATQAVRNTNVIKPGMYRIASSTTQTRAPQLNQTSRNTNPRVSTSTGVAHRTNVSRPQPRSNQMKDKVVPNTSHVKFKKTEVEEHPRISSISNQTKSVTACNDSLNSRTSNVNAVCATCGKCVFNLNHDACVSKYLNDVNARTKKPKVVPTSSRKPKSQANKSVATPHKKIVASESTITNSKSYYRKLYMKTSKAWKCYIRKQGNSVCIY